MIAADDPLLTSAELAEREGVALMTVYGWASRGTGPRRMKFNGRVTRYRLSDVLEWENAQYADAISDAPGVA